MVFGGFAVAYWTTGLYLAEDIEGRAESSARPIPAAFIFELPHSGRRASHCGPSALSRWKPSGCAQRWAFAELDLPPVCL
jgi:hypothetical protein